MRNGKKVNEVKKMQFPLRVMRWVQSGLRS